MRIAHDFAVHGREELHHGRGAGDVVDRDADGAQAVRLGTAAAQAVASIDRLEQLPVGGLQCGREAIHELAPRGAGEAGEDVRSPGNRVSHELLPAQHYLDPVARGGAAFLEAVDAE